MGKTSPNYTIPDKKSNSVDLYHWQESVTNNFEDKIFLTTEKQFSRNREYAFGHG
jgi:hypothetical protein